MVVFLRVIGDVANHIDDIGDDERLEDWNDDELVLQRDKRNVASREKRNVEAKVKGTVVTRKNRNRRGINVESFNTRENPKHINKLTKVKRSQTAMKRSRSEEIFAANMKPGIELRKKRSISKNEKFAMKTKRREKRNAMSRLRTSISKTGELNNMDSVDEVLREQISSVSKIGGLEDSWKFISNSELPRFRANENLWQNFEFVGNIETSNNVSYLEANKLVQGYNVSNLEANVEDVRSTRDSELQQGVDKRKAVVRKLRDIRDPNITESFVARDTTDVTSSTRRNILIDEPLGTIENEVDVLNSTLNETVVSHYDFQLENDARSRYLNATKVNEVDLERTTVTEHTIVDTTLVLNSRNGSENDTSMSNKDECVKKINEKLSNGRNTNSSADNPAFKDPLQPENVVICLIPTNSNFSNTVEARMFDNIDEGTNKIKTKTNSTFIDVLRGSINSSKYTNLENITTEIIPIDTEYSDSTINDFIFEGNSTSAVHESSDGSSMEKVADNTFVVDDRASESNISESIKTSENILENNNFTKEYVLMRENSSLNLNESVTPMNFSGDIGNITEDILGNIERNDTVNNSIDTIQKVKLDFAFENCGHKHEENMIDESQKLDGAQVNKTNSSDFVFENCDHVKNLEGTADQIQTTDSRPGVFSNIKSVMSNLIKSVLELIKKFTRRSIYSTSKIVRKGSQRSADFFSNIGDQISRNSLVNRTLSNIEAIRNIDMILVRNATGKIVDTHFDLMKNAGEKVFEYNRSLYDNITTKLMNDTDDQFPIRNTYEKLKTVYGENLG